MNAYQNINIVSAFEFFDEKNRERVLFVKDKLGEQKKVINDIKNSIKLATMKITGHNCSKANGGAVEAERKEDPLGGLNILNGMLNKASD